MSEKTDAKADATEEEPKGSRLGWIIGWIVLPGAFIGGILVGRAGVHLLGRQHRTDRTEPQLGGLTDEVERSLCIVDTWQLDHDRLALAGDVGLGHTECVDTLADDVESLVVALQGFFEVAAP